MKERPMRDYIYKSRNFLKFLGDAPMENTSFIYKSRNFLKFLGNRFRLKHDRNLQE